MTRKSSDTNDKIRTVEVMADDEGAECILVAEFVLLRIHQDGHHLIVIDLRKRLL